MRLLLVALVLFVLPLSSHPFAEPAAEPSRKTLAFTNVTIYTAASDKPIENGTLIVTDGKITAVGPKADVKIPDGAAFFDLAGDHHHSRPRRYAFAHRLFTSGPASPPTPMAMK